MVYYGFQIFKFFVISWCFYFKINGLVDQYYYYSIKSKFCILSLNFWEPVISNKKEVRYGYHGILKYMFYLNPNSCLWHNFITGALRLKHIIQSWDFTNVHTVKMILKFPLDIHFDSHNFRGKRVWNDDVFWPLNKMLKYCYCIHVKNFHWSLETVEILISYKLFTTMVGQLVHC